MPILAMWMGGVRERGIQGRDNSICKGLEARESLVHLAVFRSSIRLARSLGPRSDGGWGWRGGGRGGMESLWE